MKLLVSPWQNQSRRHDTNNDGLVDLFDVLIVINEINRTGSRALNANDAVPPPFLDVDGNRILDPIDALVIINFINGQGAGGEGESRDEAQANESVSSSFDLDDWTTRNRRRRVL
ncbi:MAG: dockerin type I domain-containing protein [Planctomycetota bacterium]